MCRKLIFFVCVLTLALASASYGEVIGNFGEPGNLMDGWDATPWSPPWGVTNTEDVIGATLGIGSLKSVGTGGWWTGCIGDKILTDPQVAGIVARTTTELTIDVTRFSADWTSGWWIAPSRIMATVNMGIWNEARTDQIYPAAVDSMLGGTWFPMYMDGRSDPGAGWPDPIVAGPDGVPVTEVWSLEPVFALLDEAALAGYSYDVTMDIALMVCNDGYDGNVTYYLDNAQLVPEPATMALLGLGGLALLRRKRGYGA